MTPPTPHIRVSEDTEQASLFRWFHLTRWQGRALADFAFAIPNGGTRHTLEAVKLKRTGTKAGVPDVCVAIPAGGYHGLWIEMKAIGGRLSEAQQEVISMLRSQGYRVEVCYGFDAARVAVERYLGQVGTVQERG